jgi:type I restriction enzyme S subunit
VSQASFGTAQLKALEVPLPPLDEQRRIVGLLDRAAEIRYRADVARANARAIIPALFLDTFGGPATNPKGWPVAELGNHADVQGGVQVSAKRAVLPVELPYLRVANVMRGRLDLSEIKMIRVTAAKHAEQVLSEATYWLSRDTETPTRLAELPSGMDRLRATRTRII